MVESLVATEIASLLRKKAAKHGTTLNNLLLAAYGLLISKHSRQQDMVIGSLVSGRSHADLESLVGVFINFLPVRLRLSKDLGFSEYLRRSHDTLTAAYSNQDYPFDLMVDNLVKKRDVSRNPFFDTMVNFHSEEDLNQVDNRDANGSSISVRPMKLLKKDFFQSGLDFKLDVEMKGKQLLLNLSYNLTLFSEKRMHDLLAEYTDLLSLIAGNTDFILADFMGPEPDRVEKSVESEENNAPAETLSINICSSFVVEPLQEYIEYWAKELEIDVEVNFAPYNQVFQQLLNANSILHNNAGINILFVRLDDWLRDHLNLSSGEQIGILDRTYSEFIEAVEYAQKNTVIPFLVSVVPSS